MQLNTQCAFTWAASHCAWQLKNRSTLYWAKPFRRGYRATRFTSSRSAITLQFRTTAWWGSHLNCTALIVQWSTFRRIPCRLTNWDTPSWSLERRRSTSSGTRSSLRASPLERGCCWATRGATASSRKARLCAKSSTTPTSLAIFQIKTTK